MINSDSEEWLERCPRRQPSSTLDEPRKERHCRDVNTPDEKSAPALRPRHGVEDRDQGSRPSPPPPVRDLRGEGPARRLAKPGGGLTLPARAGGRPRRRLSQHATRTLAKAGVTLEDVERLTLEEVLALPGIGPGTVGHLERCLGKPFVSHAPYWIERGLSASVAGALAAAGIRTEEKLRCMGREDLLKVEGLGPKTVEFVLFLGKPLPERRRPLSFLERVPQARIWVEAGIIPGCARRLVAAGITTIGHLERLTRDDLLAIRGISEATIEQCEKLLGRPFRNSISGYWRAKGLQPQIANTLSRGGVGSLEQLALMSREEVLRLNGMGGTGLTACEKLLGRPSHSHVEFWTSHGLGSVTAQRLIRAGIVSFDLLGSRLKSIEHRLKDDEIMICRKLLHRGP